jgi:AcrR family transcriptional regulator
MLAGSFRDEGYRKLSREDCAHTLGISTGSFNNRFGNKRAMMIITA